MLEDRYGQKLSTASRAAVDAYVEGVDLVLSGNLGPVAAFDRAVEADPDFALAHLGRARALQLRGDMAAAREALAVATRLRPAMTEREAGQLGFFQLMLAGQGDAAVRAAKQHLKGFPRDVMVLSPCTSVFGLIGFSGRAGREREQIELLEWMAPHYGDDWWFPCQHAFALDEVGRRDEARPLIERAMAVQPRNAHGAHIRAHVYYEDGEQAASRAYLARFMQDYPAAAQLYCHLNWHQALCALDGGDTAAAWAIYDSGIDPAAVWGPPLNALTDAVAFLWRAELAGCPRPPGRWQGVHDFGHRSFPRAGIAFADVHVLLADAVAGDAAGFAGRMREIAALFLEGRYAAGGVVPALAEGFLAFERGQWSRAIAAMAPVLGEHERIGGSRAQRDLVELTLLAAYDRAGRPEDAERYRKARRLP